MGKYLSEWKINVEPSSLHFVQIFDDGAAVVFDRNTHKMVKYTLDGKLIYSWGTIGDFPGTLWGVHGMATDQEGTTPPGSRRVAKERPCSAGSLRTATPPSAWLCTHWCWCYRRPPLARKL
jgi:hypothetical protein